MYTLQNEYLKVSFDEQMRLILLESPLDGTENIIAKPERNAFFLNCRHNENWEESVFADNQSFEITQKEQLLQFRCNQLRAQSGWLDIGLTLTVTLEQGELLFDAVIDNRDRNSLLVLDFEYPRVGAVKTMNNEEPSLLFPEQSGIRIDRVGQWLASRYEEESREPQANSYSTLYPGSNGSMHWMALEGGGETLFVQCRDKDHYASFLRADGCYDDPGSVSLIFGLMPFVKAGEAWTAPQSALMFYRGSWHKGADQYKQWAACFSSNHPVPSWVDTMLGYFLVINKQQYGHEMWPYETLPALYEMAKAHGFDTLGLFGWYHSGHDNQYPDLEVSESLGGSDGLRTAIKQVQQAGGRVTLYQQGHLIDPTTDYYRDGGYRYESRNRNNLPYWEYYDKAHKSTFMEYFTSKYFALSCPSCPEWRELMCQKIDWAKTFGPDGVLFDQIGGLPPYPCFNEDHPHEKGKPSLSISGGRKKLLAEMQSQSKKEAPEFAFFSEHITDVYAAHLDCLHGIGSMPSPEGAYIRENARIGPVNEPSLFRYCFPSSRVTIRNPRPYISKRAANYVFAFGFVFELEIRYQADCEDILADKWPEERIYAQKVSNLRKRYSKELLQASFVDDRLIDEVSPGIIAKAYESGDTTAVALWNDSTEDKPLTLSVKGARLKEYSTVDQTLSALPDRIPARTIALALFENG